MTYKVVLVKRAQKEFNGLDAKTAARVRDILLLLGSNPYLGKKLGGELRGQWSVRVWPFRILYIIDVGLVLVSVLKIQHRKDVYK